MQPRTIKYVTTADLGFNVKEAHEIASAIDVSFGDAELTIVHADRFQEGVTDAINLRRGAAVRDKLLNAQTNYVAFEG